MTARVQARSGGWTEPVAMGWREETHFGDGDMYPSIRVGTPRVRVGISLLHRAPCTYTPPPALHSTGSRGWREPGQSAFRVRALSGTGSWFCVCKFFLLKTFTFSFFFPLQNRLCKMVTIRDGWVVSSTRAEWLLLKSAL